MPHVREFENCYWRTPGLVTPGAAEVTADTLTQDDYRAVADNLPTLCWLARADGYIVWYNRRWHDYCGTTAEHMEGWGWQSVHDPEVLPQVMEAWTASIATAEPFEMVFPLKGADSHFRPFLTRCVPIKDAEGTVQRWIGNNVEISEQQRVEVSLRRAQDELRALNRTLEQRVEQRTQLHEETQEQLRQSQKLEVVGQLTGGVAHDFNNLLTVIRGSVDLLRRDDLTPEKRARYIDAIGTTADRAAKLTSQLLAFARRQSLKPSLFNVGECLREILEMVTTLTGSRIQLDLHLPDEPYFIMADRSQFDAAIVNLTVNARDAMDGEGTLTITTGPVSGIPAVRSHPPVVGDFIAVNISDTGRGIPKEVQGRIFEPFFTTKGVGQGTGLGLSQVIGFAKQSGGDIRVNSSEGEGATFTLYLPRANLDQSADQADGPAAEEHIGEGICVLVVEDNEEVGNFARDALRELGYDSVLAIDAHSALAELERDCSRFHVVFSDVVMPGMNGLELAGEIRRAYPDVPVVLTSGYSHVLAENGRHGFELLHKPYSIEQLARVLGKAVVWHRNLAGMPR